MAAEMVVNKLTFVLECNDMLSLVLKGSKGAKQDQNKRMGRMFSGLLLPKAGRRCRREEWKTEMSGD